MSPMATAIAIVNHKISSLDLQSSSNCCNATCNYNGTYESMMNDYAAPTCLTNRYITTDNNITTENTTQSPQDEAQAKMAVWQYHVAHNIRPSKADLLSDYVNPAEECHMELKPDDATSVALKAHHKRTNSNATDVTDVITDFGFLEDCFDYFDGDLPVMECGDLEESVVKMVFD